MRSVYPRRKRLALGLWCIGWLGIAIVLFAPLRSGMIGRADLLIHFLIFGSMAFSAVGFCRNPAHLVLCSLLTIVMSLLFEMAQGFVPHRSADPLDGLANMLGAATGVAVALATWQSWVRAAEPQDQDGELWPGREAHVRTPIGRRHREDGPLLERKYVSLNAQHVGRQASLSALAAAPNPELYGATKAAQHSVRMAYRSLRNGGLSPPA